MTLMIALHRFFKNVCRWVGTSHKVTNHAKGNFNFLFLAAF
jgi:hypothetical protein